MEIGEKATVFEHEPYETTLQKCLRYFEDFGSVANQAGGIGLTRNRTNVNTYNGTVHYHKKRATPTGTADFDRLHKSGVAYDTISSLGVTLNNGVTDTCIVNCEPDNDSTISTYGYLGEVSGTGQLSLDAEL